MRVNTAGGNCCEVLVAATRDGRLVEFGGSFPAVSSDQGRTFTEIRPLVPPTSDFDDAAPRQAAVARAPSSWRRAATSSA